MAAPFLPPGIKAKAASRGRIPVSDEDRIAARAGMGGEKIVQAKQAAATTSPEPVATVATEPTAPDVAPTQLAAPVVATTADAEPMPAPTVATAPAAAPAQVATAPMVELMTEPTPAPVVATESDAPTVTAAAAAAPTAVATEPAAPTKPAQPTATAAPGRRGRKPSVAPGSVPVVLHSLKVPEPSWLEIKVVVAQLMAVADVPHNIQTYIEAAHKHYEAHLRKQGKLPPK